MLEREVQPWSQCRRRDSGPRRPWLGVAAAFLCIAFAAAPAAQAEPRGLDLVCPLVEYERERDLQDSLVELELARNEYKALSKLFDMIAKLWNVKAIEQEMYLDYRRLRDRTKVRIAQLISQVSQEESIVEQYALTCAHVRGDQVDGLQEKVAELQESFRRLDCEVLARDAEIAAIDYEFDREMLDATSSLSAKNVKSRYDLVIDEYDLSQSHARLKSYRKRARDCRKRLED